MVRTRIRTLVALLVLVGCGETITDHIDALRESGARYAHSMDMLPSPERLAEIHPESEPDEREQQDLRSRLRENEHGRAVLDAGESAVQELVRLLDDAERRILAAVFLAEIGGEQAATALLVQWRDLRDRVQHKKVEGSYVKGSRYEGIDHEFYSELIYALCYAGRPVAAAVAADTRAAMDDSETRQAAGEDMRRKETRQDVAGEIKLWWDIESVETGCEGLQILAVTGAPEAPAMYVRALRSLVRSFRWTGAEYFGYLGKEGTQVFPALGALLDDDDVDVREGVIWQLENGCGLICPSTDERREEWARWFKQRLREQGKQR